jgi:hypothetical protein
MMWSFMTSGYLTWGAELDEGPDGSDAALFPKENVVMMVFGGRPQWGGAAYPSYAPGSQITVVGTAMAMGITVQVLHSTQVKI